MITVITFLMLELQLTGTQGGLALWLLPVRNGDEVILPCSNQCNRTTWSFSGSKVLFNRGQKEDRVRLNANCSLVIHKVRPGDAGTYTCKVADDTGRTPVYVVDISLSVVDMTEQKGGDSVTLHCSVSTFEKCEKTALILSHKSTYSDRDQTFIKTLQSPCSATVTILNHTYSNISSYDFTCAVKTFGSETKRFAFSPHSTDKETNSARTSENNTNTVAEQQNGDSVTLSSSVSLPDECEEEKVKWIQKSTAWWRVIIVVVVLASLVTAVVIINIWTKASENIHVENLDSVF